MRAKMLKAHLPDTNNFNVKHHRGGIIDVEFIVQYLVLRHGVEHKELLEHGGNIRLLKYAASLGLIDNSLAEQCVDAYRSYRIWLHQHRLRGNENVVVNKEVAAPHANAVVSLWDSVFSSNPA
jgi:glutamate-ammonia-ligase adenylyltransferase